MLPMAVPLIYMAFILHFFPPSLSLSCQHVRCGNIDIGYPFYTNASPNECKGKFLIDCDFWAPVIQFMGVNYNVRSISYPDHVITIQDPALNSFFFNKQCNFLYSFATPIPNFNVSRRPILSSSNPFMCTQEDYNSFISFFDAAYNYTICRDYSIYYRNESDYQLDRPLNCSSSQPNLFEWMLSFSEESEGLSFSLLSAGFSRQLELRKECFNCQLQGKNCSGNVPTVEHNCPRKEGNGANKKKIIEGSAAGVGFLVVCLSLVFYFYKRRKVAELVIFGKKDLSNNKKIEALLEEYGSVAPKRYSYSNVKEITKTFHEKLGQGGYGTVYKGILRNGHAVAVKILNDSKGDGEEFINEVASICRTSHVNVVRLLGFCHEGSKKALIYEFMCNGSLEKMIYREKPKTTHDWQKLYEIAIGIARGLEYLHRGCNTRIVHFDIKPHNILLDQNFCPKISDFGLAKLCLESIISIAGARGTIGYIAPEVFSRIFGVVSSKSDVYSYGMLVLDIVGGRKNPNEGVENSSETYFPHWIYAQLNQNGHISTYGVTAESEVIARKMVLVGLWCIQTLPESRPSMSRVVEMMEGSGDDLQIPPKPYLSSSPFGSIIATSSVQDVECSSSVDS